MNKISFIYDNILLSADKNPDKVAITNYEEKKAGYKDFVNVYENFTKFLIKKNIKEYSRIVILIKDEIDMSLSILPVMENAILTLLDYDMSVEQFDYYYKLLKVDYIITDDLSSQGCIAAQKIGVGIIFLQITGPMNNKTCEMDIKSDKTIKNSNGFEMQSDIITVATTSGTTSTPKIVPSTYKQFIASLNSRIRYFEYSSGDTTLIVAKLYKTTSIRAMLTMLMVGGSTVVCNGFVHSTFMKLINDNKVTTLTASPAVLSSYADYAKTNGIEFKDTSLRFIRSSGAPLSKSLKESLESLFKAPIEQSYGMTETANISCTYKSPKGYKEGSVGISSLLNIKVFNEEILVKGDSVFPGYENEEIDNNEYFTDGWFHTGDMGYIDKDGYIFITGRIKEMINRGGEKISPYEVENAILKHPDILNAAVFPYPNSYGSEDAGAVMVLNNGKQIDLVSLRKYLKGKISAYKMPSLLYIVKDIPISKNDKIQRKMLFSQLSSLYPEQGNNQSGEIVEKQSKTEKIVRKIWIKTLKISKFDNNMTFSELGGDSLKGAVVLSQIEHDFNISVPVNILFGEGTVKSVSEYIDKEGKKYTDYKFLVPIKESGNKKPLICVHSGTGDAVTYRHIGAHMDKDRPVYAIRFSMRNFQWAKPLTFENLARAYSDEIKRLDPEGPYYLCGNCWGGVLAFKIASTLKSDGCKVGMLALFDSAYKGKKMNTRTGGLLNRVRITFIESLDQLKELNFNGKIKLIIKKTGNILNFVMLSQNKKVYLYGLKINSDFLMNLSGKTGALGFAYQKYLPKFYNGEIHYFKAVKGMSGRNKNEEYWKGMAEVFKLIEINCHHNAMVVGDNSKLLTDKLSEIIEERNV